MMPAMTGGAIFPSSSDAVARARAERLVDLEQQRRAVRRADDGVRLEQLAFLALEHVLVLAEIAELGVRRARRLLEELELLVAEREGAADELRDVGVEDRPVARPQLHAQDSRRLARRRVVEDLALDEVVELFDRGLVAAHDRVAQPGGLDDASRRAHALVRELLGLVDRDVAQREEPADADHGDGGDAAEHEARDGRADARRRRGGAVAALRPKSH